MDAPTIADERAVSPVVSVALLIAIVVLLATAIGAAVFGQDLGSAEAPSVTLSFAVDGNDVVMTHEGGDVLPADQVVVVDQDGNELAGLSDDMMAGERDTIVDDTTGVERIRVVWESPDDSSGEVLATFEL